jgi:hypothetical protein
MANIQNEEEEQQELSALWECTVVRPLWKAVWWFTSI